MVKLNLLSPTLDLFWPTIACGITPPKPVAFQTSILATFSHLTYFRLSPCLVPCILCARWKGNTSPVRLVFLDLGKSDPEWCKNNRCRWGIRVQGNVARALVALVACGKTWSPLAPSALRELIAWANPSLTTATAET